MFKKRLALAIVLILSFGVIFIAILWWIAFKPNINLPANRPYTYFYVHTGWNFNQTYKSLVQQNLLKNPKTFLLTAKLKRFDHPKPGRYKITKDLSNNTLINKLRAGLQEPVSLTINLIRTKQQLAGYVSKHLELDSLSLLNLLNNRDYLKQFGFTPQDVMAMFIPNTYQFYWNTSADQFIRRMYREYRRFWTRKRLEKARKIGLSPKQVIILASIVEAEQMQHPDEWPKIAGLYMNRLKKGIPLQSDPTLIYAWGDFTIKRVYNYHKKIDSPYNTYKYKGLPPGPILTPDIRAIDAVLNYQHHPYLYMVAKADFSGYHVFSRTLSQHLKYARMYQKALNQRNIK